MCFADRQVRQTQNVDVHVSVHVAYHPMGTNTPPSQCRIFCLLKSVKYSSLSTSTSRQLVNYFSVLKEYSILFLILKRVLVYSVPHRVTLYVYVYANVYVSCLPNVQQRRGCPTFFPNSPQTKPNRCWTSCSVVRRHGNSEWTLLTFSQWLQNDATWRCEERCCVCGYWPTGLHSQTCVGWKGLEGLRGVNEERPAWPQSHPE